MNKLLVSICATSLLFACEGNPSNGNSTAGQIAFAYNNAETVNITSVANGDTIEIDAYSDIDISGLDNTNFIIDANDNWMQLTVGHEGDISNATVTLIDHPKTLFTQVAGSNNELIYQDAGILGNFVQIAGENNRLVMPANSKVQFDPYYSADNLFQVVGNGHYLEFGEGSTITNIKITLLNANTIAHTVCAPQAWLDLRGTADSPFVESTAIDTVFLAKGTSC